MKSANNSAAYAPQQQRKLHKNNRKANHAAKNNSNPNNNNANNTNANANKSEEPLSKPRQDDKHFTRCRSSLLDKLRTLRDSHILRYSLLPSDTTFEILEFYGDAVLYERISYFLMQTRRFMSPHLLSGLRRSVVRNTNLALCFETLGLGGLFDKEKSPNLMKGKADVVEAIIGELSEACHSTTHGQSMGDTTTVRGALDEFIAYIAFSGERNYVLEDQSSDGVQKPATNNNSDNNNNNNNNNNNRHKHSDKHQSRQQHDPPTRDRMQSSPPSKDSPMEYAAPQWGTTKLFTPSFETDGLEVIDKMSINASSSQSPIAFATKGGDSLHSNYPSNNTLQNNVPYSFISSLSSSPSVYNNFAATSTSSQAVSSSAPASSSPFLRTVSPTSSTSPSPPISAPGTPLASPMYTSPPITLQPRVNTSSTYPASQTLSVSPTSHGAYLSASGLATSPVKPPAPYVHQQPPSVSHGHFASASFPSAAASSAPASASSSATALFTPAYAATTVPSSQQQPQQLQQQPQPQQQKASTLMSGREIAEFLL